MQQIRLPPRGVLSELAQLWPGSARDWKAAWGPDHHPVEVRARSGQEMRRNLSWWDLMWFGVSCVVGAGIFVLTGQEAHDAAGPAVVLSYVVSGVAAMLSVLCYTEFAVEIPVAGLLLKNLGLFGLFVVCVFVSLQISEVHAT